MQIRNRQNIIYFLYPAYDEAHEYSTECEVPKCDFIFFLVNPRSEKCLFGKLCKNRPLSQASLSQIEILTFNICGA